MRSNFFKRLNGHEKNLTTRWLYLNFPTWNTSLHTQSVPLMSAETLVQLLTQTNENDVGCIRRWFFWDIGYLTLTSWCYEGKTQMAMSFQSESLVYTRGFCRIPHKDCASRSLQLKLVDSFSTDGHPVISLTNNSQLKDSI